MAIVMATLATAATAAIDHSSDLLYRDSFEPYAGQGPTQVCTYTPDADGFFTLTSPQSPYTVRLPVGYDVQHPQPQRLLVAIHGCGDTAANFATWAAVPFSLRATQDYIALSVGGRDGTCWNASTDGVIVEAAIAHASSCFFVHPHKVVLAGYSSGGGLAYRMAMTDAQAYAGVLIENSGLYSVVGSGNVDATLDAADWNINVAHTARIDDASYPIASVHADWEKMIAHQFPLQSREIAGVHGDTATDWEGYLIPKMGAWVSP